MCSALLSQEGFLNVLFQLELGFLKAILGVVAECSCSYLLIYFSLSHWVGGTD